MGPHTEPGCTPLMGSPYGTHIFAGKASLREIKNQEHEPMETLNTPNNDTLRSKTKTTK